MKTIHPVVTRCCAFLLLASGLALGLNACGGGGGNTGDNNSQIAQRSPATAAPGQLISAQRMSDLVRELAGAKYEGRLPGTAGDKLAQDYLVNEFKSMGLVPAFGDSYLQGFNTTIVEPDGESHGNPENPLYGERMSSSNIIGIIPGNDPVLAREVIIISGHRDHLGRTPGGIHYPGANDDLSGLASTMELARAFTQLKARNKPNKRTLMFVAYGAEEQHEMGSMYHVAHPVPGMPNKNIVLMISIDMIGLGFEKWSDFSQARLDTYADTWYQEVYNDSNNDADDYSHEYPPENRKTFSYDAGPFGKIGVNNRVFGTTSNVATYHKTTDTWESVNFGPAVIVTRTIFDFLWKVDQDPHVRIKA